MPNMEELFNQLSLEISHHRITIHMPQRTSKILLVRLTANKNASLFQIALRVLLVTRCDMDCTLRTAHCTLVNFTLCTV